MTLTVNDYATVQDMYSALPDMLQGDNLYNVLFTRLVKAASRLIDRATKRQPGAYYVNSDVINYYSGGGGSAVVYPYGKPAMDNGSRVQGVTLRIDELATTPTEIAISQNGSITTYTALASTDYFLGPDNAVNFSKPFTTVTLDTLNGNYAVWPSYRKSIKITGKFGYSILVPDLIKQTTITQVGRWFNRSKQGYQGSHTITEGDTTISYVDKLDTDLQQQLNLMSRKTI